MWDSAAVVELQKDHVVCLESLAQILNRKRKKSEGATSMDIEGEVKALLEKAGEIESMIEKHRPIFNPSKH